MEGKIHTISTHNSKTDHSCDLYKILQEELKLMPIIKYIPLNMLDTVNSNMIPTFF